MVESPTVTPLVRFRYAFRFSDGGERVFDVSLDRRTRILLPPSNAALPPWTQLGFHQCEHCPLKADDGAHCPVAVSLVPVIEAFGDRKSHENVEVRVESEARTYSKPDSLQNALSALVGLLMATAGCPILDPLRPMADMHLPFMTREETHFRMLATHLVRQFLAERRGATADWSLAGLQRLIHDLFRLNVGFCRRLNAIVTSDASVNAVVVLSLLADFSDSLLSDENLDRLNDLFEERDETFGPLPGSG
jgi:hypothetical protein